MNILLSIELCSSQRRIVALSGEIKSQKNKNKTVLVVFSKDHYYSFSRTRFTIQ